MFKRSKYFAWSNVEKTVEGFIRNWPILSLQSRNRAVMLVDKTKQNKNTFAPGGRKTLSFLSTKMVRVTSTNVCNMLAQA